MEVQLFKHYVNNKENINRNTRFVVIKQNRKCCHCGKTIQQGTECLTLNKKGAGRSWMCNDCVSLRLQISVAESIYNSTTFDDEGGAMANLEYLNSLKGEWYEREQSCI